ncbi:MAG TPA: hypothetical protein VGC15_14760 [Acetobacteraceae bacterium]
MTKFGIRGNWPSFKASVLAGAYLAAFAHVAPASASPTYAFQQTIAGPGGKSISGYDLSVFDPSNQLFYFTDRTNNGIDVFSAATNSYVTQIGSGLFAGSQGGNNDIAGPNGLYLSTTTGGGSLLLAGNGTSNVVGFNLNAAGTGVIGSPFSISTAVAGTPSPPNRVDGVAYAPAANTILAANNASDPGFLTLINNATGTVTKSILLNGITTDSNGSTYPNVGGNGVEATIFNTARGTYFVAVPTLSIDGDGNPADAGGVIELDAATGNLLHTYSFASLGLTGACSPTGLVQGAGASMFVACSDPTATGSILLDPTGNGSIKVASGIRGGDQTAYDPTNNTFFEAARFQPDPLDPTKSNPVLGIIDASTLAVQLLPGAFNIHSVAVDPVSNEVFVATSPLSSGVNPYCTNGCIAVFAAATTAVPEPASLPLITVALAGLAVLAGLHRRA